MLNLFFAISFMCISVNAQLTVYCNMTLYPYTNGCPDNSKCVNGNGNVMYPICQCESGYITYQNNTFCGYKRSCAVTPLLLSLFFQWLFPVGQVYISECNTDTLSGRLAIAQIFTSGICGFLIGSIFCCIIGIFLKSEEVTTLILQLYGAFITLLTVIWWIVNIVNNAKSITTDSNGVSISYSTC